MVKNIKDIVNLRGDAPVKILKPSRRVDEHVLVVLRQRPQRRFQSIVRHAITSFNPLGADGEKIEIIALKQAVRPNLALYAFGGRNTNSGSTLLNERTHKQISNGGFSRHLQIDA